MKKAILAFLLSLLIVAPVHSQNQISIEQIQKSIVMVGVIAPQANKNIGCTGIVTSTVLNEVLTAAHCVEQSGLILVDNVPSQILRKDKDIAILRYELKNKPPAQIRKGSVKVGENVIAVGFAWGELAALGRMVAKLDEGTLWMDGPVIPGMSGGPVIDKNGQVVGIIQISNNVVSGSTDAKQIRKLLGY